MLMAAIFAHPNVQRRAPITATREGPIIQIFKPIAEALFPDVIRIPMHLLILCHHLIAELRHIDVPRRLRIIDQRGAATPAMRIIMFNFLFRIEFAVFAQILEHLRIGIHHESAFIRAFCKFALFIDRIHIG